MKKLLVIAIASMLLVSGCGKKDKDSTSTGDASSTQSSTGALSENGFKVGEIDVSKDIISYFETAMSQGQEVTAQVQSQAKAQAQQLATYAAIGKKMNLDIKSDYDAYVAQIATQQNTTIEDFKKKQNISDELFDFVCYGAVYQQKLLEECKKENNIDEKASEQFFKENFWRAKHLLLMTQDKSDDEKKEIKAKIDGLYERAKAGEDFDKLIEEFNEDPGMKSNPDGYVFTDGEMVPEFQKGVSDIKVGEFNLVETSYGYHIVKRLALDETPELYKKFLADSKEKIDTAMVNDKMNEFIENKMKEYNIEVK